MPPETDRRDYSTLIAVIEERLDNFKTDNKKDHDIIMKKIDETNGVKSKLNAIIESNKWRDWAIRLLYGGVVIVLIVEVIKSRLR